MWYQGRWRMLGAVLVLVTASIGLVRVAPDATGQDEPPVDNTGIVCLDSVPLLGRCVTVAGQATLCLDSLTCVTEPASQPSLECFAPNVDFGSVCETERSSANQNPPKCPEGTRGEPGACFYYRALLTTEETSSCPLPSQVDADGQCRNPVQDAALSYFCSDELVLDGIDCVATEPALPGACDAGSDRVLGACFGNAVALTTTCGDLAVAANGQCQEPVTVPSGSAACEPGTLYFESEAACVLPDPAAAIIPCVYPEHDTVYEFNNMCRVVEPIADPSCPVGYSFDDVLAGNCARVEELVTCPVGSARYPLNQSWCTFVAPLETGTCPAGFSQLSEAPLLCAMELALTNTVTCDEIAIYVNDTTSCFRRIGPQPDICPARVDGLDCYELAGPFSNCGEALDCATIEPAIVAAPADQVGDVSCDLALSKADATMMLEYLVDKVAASTQTDCADVNPDEIRAAAADLTADARVSIHDARLAAACVADPTGADCP